MRGIVPGKRENATMQLDHIAIRTAKLNPNGILVELGFPLPSLADNTA